jgi:hypothetical protein
VGVTVGTYVEGVTCGTYVVGVTCGIVTEEGINVVGIDVGGGGTKLVGTDVGAGIVVIEV